MEELPIIQKTYNLIKWYLPLIEGLPRKHKYLLGERILNNLYNLLEGLNNARYAHQKLSQLEPLKGTVDIIKYQTQLLCDFQLISLEKRESAQQQLRAIGLDLGGWIRQQQQLVTK